MINQVSLDHLPDQPPILTDEEAELYQSLCTPNSVIVVRDPNSQRLIVSVQASTNTQHSTGERCAVKPVGTRSLVELLDENGKSVGVCHRANLPVIFKHFGIENEQTN